jgi:N utilization substance protein B
MITRRHIRIKVMHHLYAHSTNEELGAAVLLKNLEKSLEDVYELFAWDLGAFLRIHRAAEKQYELVESRQIPDPELLSRISKFRDLKFFELCRNSASVASLLESNHVNWSEYDHIFRGLWEKLFQSDAFEAFLDMEDYGALKRFLREVYQEYIAENETLHELYEDMNGQWEDDLDAAQMMTAKVISNWKEDSETITVPNLFKDDEDANFGSLLMRTYFQFAEDSARRIEERSKNWDSDRIAKLDIILMKMCIAEWRGFKEIPVKVSLNEYLDLSKEYSTPKSSAFINGILDKIGTNLRSEGLVQKVGRGIIE